MRANDRERNKKSSRGQVRRAGGSGVEALFASCDVPRLPKIALPVSMQFDR